MGVPAGGIPGAVTAGFTCFTKVADILTDPAQYAAWSRERKMEFVREGLDASLDASDWPGVNRFMGMYRVLDEQTGP